MNALLVVSMLSTASGKRLAARRLFFSARGEILDGDGVVCGGQPSPYGKAPGDSRSSDGVRSGACRDVFVDCSPNYKGSSSAYGSGRFSPIRDFCGGPGAFREVLDGSHFCSSGHTPAGLKKKSCGTEASGPDHSLPSRGDTGAERWSSGTEIGGADHCFPKLGYFDARNRSLDDFYSREDTCMSLTRLLLIRVQRT